MAEPGVRQALAVLVLYLGAQLGASFLVSIGAGLYLAVQAFFAAGADLDALRALTGPELRESGRAFDPKVRPVAAFAGMLAGALTLALSTRAWAGARLRDPPPFGVGLRASSRSQLAGSLAAGASLAFTFLVITSALLPPDQEITPGPISELAAQPGASRAVWIVLALLLAPPVEELLFRGVLLSALTHAWGFRWAAVAVTLIFVALHLNETLRYPPATLAVLGLAVLTLLLCWRYASLGPAIAAHAGYNLVIVALLLAS